MTRVESLFYKLTAKAVFDYNLIEEGDRILVAVSGGKDSTAMSYALSKIRPALKRNYDLVAIHISSDFCACCKKSALKDILTSVDIPFVDLHVPIIGRLKPGKEMNCFWCSTQRRTELLKYAMENGFNKIALGHHLDDIIETFFMNMMFKGELSGMPVKLAYNKYPVSLIRPLAYIEEKQVIELADILDFRKAACTCPYGVKSKRRDVRKQIQELTGGSSAIKHRIFESMGNVKFDSVHEDRYAKD